MEIRQQKTTKLIAYIYIYIYTSIHTSIHNMLCDSSAQMATNNIRFLTIPLTAPADKNLS